MSRTDKILCGVLYAIMVFAVVDLIASVTYLVVTT